MPDGWRNGLILQCVIYYGSVLSVQCFYDYLHDFFFVNYSISVCPVYVGYVFIACMYFNDVCVCIYKFYLGMGRLIWI